MSQCEHGALQDEAIEAWRGDPKLVAAGQEAFHAHAKLNSAAHYGKYSDKLEKELVGV